MIYHAGQKPSLLLIDDDQVGRDALKRRFQRQGYDIDDTGNALQGLELLHKGQFDLVLLDIEMPEIDGFEVLKAIRKTHPATNLPVIMITAKDQGRDIVRALQLGANDYITKPLDFSVVLARVQSHLSLNRTSHLFGVFGAQFQDCLKHFFPNSTLVVIQDGEPVRWREGPAHANYRLGEVSGRPGIAIEWLRSRYWFVPREHRAITAAEHRLAEIIVQVLDTRYRAMFDLGMPNRLELVHHLVEDWVVAEYLSPQNPLPVLECLKLLRVAALLTYENRKVSTGVLIVAGELEESDGKQASPLPRIGSWLFQEKGLQRLCDGTHTLFLSDPFGWLKGVIDIGQWSLESQGARPLPGPCPMPYVPHARATLDGRAVCLILTLSQEIKVFAQGIPVFAFRGARWRLLDIQSKFHEWSEAVGVPGSPFARQLFQSALNLAEARHGALFVVLDRPEESLGKLVSPGNWLSDDGGAGGAAHDDRSVFERVVQMTLQRQRAIDMGPHVFEALSMIDGAVVVNRDARLLAVGAILRVAAGEADGATFEGARTTAAAAASQHGPVLKVSEDGVVTFFHRGRLQWDV